MKLAVQKSHLVTEILCRSPGPVKKTASKGGHIDFGQFYFCIWSTFGRSGDYGLELGGSPRDCVLGVTFEIAGAHTARIGYAFALFGTGV